MIFEHIVTNYNLISNKKSVMKLCTFTVIVLCHF